MFTSLLTVVLCFLIYDALNRGYRLQLVPCLISRLASPERVSTQCPLNVHESCNMHVCVPLGANWPTELKRHLLRNTGHPPTFIANGYLHYGESQRKTFETIKNDLPFSNLLLRQYICCAFKVTLLYYEFCIAGEGIVCTVAIKTIPGMVHILCSRKSFIDPSTGSRVIM